MINKTMRYEQKMRKALVTGASGFVAEHLIPELRGLGFFVYGLDRKNQP